MTNLTLFSSASENYVEVESSSNLVTTEMILLGPILTKGLAFGSPRDLRRQMPGHITPTLPDIFLTSVPLTNPEHIPTVPYIIYIHTYTLASP